MNMEAVFSGAVFVIPPRSSKVDGSSVVDSSVNGSSVVVGSVNGPSVVDGSVKGSSVVARWLCQWIISSRWFRSDCRSFMSHGITCRSNG